jgi:uncharacterized glyoxalase superfamily protein PhnB
MKNPPEGWSRITPALFYADAAKAIDWLCDAFGFEVQLKVEGSKGEIVHSELVFGGGMIMVGQAGRRPKCATPKALDGQNTQSLMIFVDDVDAYCKHARSKGATIVGEPEVHDYGEEWWSDRSCEALDCEGHRWWIVQRMRSPKAPPPKHAKHDT